MINLKTQEEFNNRRYVGGQHLEVPLRFKLMLGMIPRKKGKKILDVGCNDGLFGELLLKKGSEVFGVDISKPALKLAQKRGLKTYCLNLETDRLPFTDGSIDVVVSSETLAFVYDTDAVFREIRRVLKKRGVFVMTTANPLSLGRRIFYLFGKGIFLEADLEGDNSGVIRFFTKASLEYILKKYGFEIIKFTADAVNFTKDGKLCSTFLAKIFPSLGGIFVVSARKK